MSSNWPNPQRDPPRGPHPGEPRVGLLIFGIFVVAVVMAIISKAIEGDNSFSLGYVAGIFGATTALFVFPGIIPMIWWAFCRFDRRKATAPLIIWVALTGLFGFMSIRGNMYRADPPEFMRYTFQPTGCEFRILFPSPPAQTEFTEAALNEVELTTSSSMLRAGCVAIDTTLLKGQGKLSELLTDLAERQGIQNVVYSHSTDSGVVIGAAQGTKRVEGRTVIFEYRWYVGNNSLLTTTTGGLKKNYPVRDVNQFHESVTRPEYSN